MGPRGKWVADGSHGRGALAARRDGHVGEAVGAQGVGEGVGLVRLAMNEADLAGLRDPGAEQCPLCRARLPTRPTAPAVDAWTLPQAPTPTVDLSMAGVIPCQERRFESLAPPLFVPAKRRATRRPIPTPVQPRSTP